ncbi:cisplatin damage response ATP-dependent DNA ligase [Phreatobacter cathodiphilus]|uniref:DNA ligase (ATP) n=1 Tax=Phreatobacter cathodiphilus TaxID=1868589 RepID=A0A2S0NEI9_9HYPH|nr:cisplatin damage response ATP-dependent DNA ligase [Phreatobacter cathodiphilus]AVO46361.1 ATP-dependent DNA ligase [Phreatobacter cathodiphilus]
MNRFAALLDRLAYEPRRNAKLALITDYFRTTPDPERGWALAAMTGALTFRNAKAGLIRGLIAERTDPVLFALSYDYVGDLSETVALMWPTPEAPLPPRSGGEGGPSASGGPGGGKSAPGLNAPPPLTPPLRERGEGNAPFAASGATAAHDDAGATPEDPLPPRSGGEGGPSASGGPDGERLGDVPAPSPIGHNRPPPPALSEVVAGLGTTSKTALPKLLAGWLDHLDETGRWALLKLITGSLRIGVSARLAKTAVAALGPRDPDEIELVWPGLTPPYESLFAWVEGRGERPESVDPAPFRPPMLAHGIEEADFGKLDPADFAAEWKWDGIRVQAAAGPLPDGRRVARLYSRTGEDISGAFPDLVETLAFDGAIDGELLVLRENRVQSFNVLQQRLNRKQVTVPLLAEFPAHIRAYDLLFAGGEDLRDRPFAARRAILEQMVSQMANPRIDISPLVPFETWEGLAAIRLDPSSADAGEDAEAIEGLMIKRRDSPYLPGRPKGPWWKWKRDPMVVDCVLMYAQRGHGKRSSFYSDFTFGVWRDGAEGDELVPVGKAYFGFTDEELGQLDRFVRNHTTNRFGPVREVTHTAREGLVLEIAFEGLQRSTRHKSGIAMRFPRISRIRWDKPPGEADRIEALELRLKG